MLLINSGLNKIVRTGLIGPVVKADQALRHTSSGFRSVRHGNGQHLNRGRPTHEASLIHSTSQTA